MICAHAALRVGHCPLQQLFDILLLQRLQFEDHRSGEQSAVHLKVRVLCRRADQNQGAVLHKRKQVILLAFIKAVNLVDEQNCLLPVHAEVLLRLLHDCLHILFPGDGRIDLGEFGLRRVGDDAGECRLSRARRSVKNERAQLVCPDRPVEQLIFADDVLLPDHLI